MTVTKENLLLVAVAAFWLLTASQGMAEPGHPPRMDMEKIFLQLNLTAEEQEQFEQLVAIHREEFQTLIESQKEDRDRLHTQRHQLREEHREQMQMLLGDDQMRAFEALLPKHHHRGKRFSDEPQT